MCPIVTWNIANTNCLVPFEDDSIYPGIRPEMKIGLNVHNAMNICCILINSRFYGIAEKYTCSSITTAPGVPIDVLGPDLTGVSSLAVWSRLSVDCVLSRVYFTLDIVRVRNTYGIGSTQEVVGQLRNCATV
jgi:hypothetical protein